MSAPGASGKDRVAAGLEHETADVNNTLYWRLLTISLLKFNTASRRVASLFKRRLQPHVGHAHHLTRNMVVKTGADVRLAEAATMRFVAENTSIPVPRVLSAFVRKGATYIVMETIKGQQLDALWRRMPDETRATLLDHLRQIVDELRALEPPTEFAVGSCTGGSLQDFRQSQAPPPVRFGPFRTIQDFHSWLRKGLGLGQARPAMEQAESAELDEMIARQDGPWPPPVFTHADLNPSNIMVRNDKIVGIIDWEMSGWYPHYWEYTSLKIGSEIVREYWYENIEKFLTPFPEELKMEKIRFHWWGNII